MIKNVESFFSFLGQSAPTAKEVAQNMFSSRELYQRNDALSLWKDCVHDILKSCITFEDFKLEYEALSAQDARKESKQ